MRIDYVRNNSHFNAAYKMILILIKKSVKYKL